jgi:hypothetical protein
MYKVNNAKDRFNELLKYSRKISYEKDEKLKDKLMMEFTMELYNRAIKQGINKDKMLYEDLNIAKDTLGKYMQLTSIFYLIFSVLGLIDKQSSVEFNYKVSDDSDEDVMNKISKINNCYKFSEMGIDLT